MKKLIVACALLFPLPFASAEEQAVTGLVSSLDKSVDPCTDFYQFACGGWMKANPVPSDQAAWGRFNELIERNRETLRGILEKASVKDPKRTPLDQKIGDDYAACMDEAAAEALGARPLQGDFDRITAIKSNSELGPFVAHLHERGVGVFFAFRSEQDFKDTTQFIAAVDEGGLSLPDRDYYLKGDPESVAIRKQYVEHVQRMFQLLGETPQLAASHARAAMDFETALAKVTLERVKRRDPANIYHKMTRENLVALAPAFPWAAYFASVGTPGLESLNVAAPDFAKGLAAVLKSTSLDSVRTYLRWHVLHDSATLLSKAFVDENFAFFGKVLAGAKENQARWKRCTDAVDADLGEALGERYVELAFGKEGYERTTQMVAAIEKALEGDIRELPWMTEATRAQALGKLHAIANKVGYPERWRDYSSLEIVREDYFGNSSRSGAFEFKRQLAKIGKPLDRKEWDMTPPTVNAGYNPTMNDINFPAGILQPPFFDRHADDAVNLGAIGAVIGHELTHGFDDEGRKFAANGNLTDWWTSEDAKEFEKRAGCIADEYSGFTSVGDLKLNGRLTLGENVADNGGLRMAYRALQEIEAGKTKVDGLTPEQRFFLGYGQVWCENRTDEYARLAVQVDPHSPGRYRVNGVVSNMPEFQQAFGCKASSPMVRENRCRVW
jgi:putative endopeptidase